MTERRNGILIDDATLNNTGGTATLGAILGDTANSSIATRLTALATLADWLPRTVKKTGLAIDGGTVPDVFTIAGGPIEILGLNMLVTTAVSAHNCACYWLSDPTMANYADTPLCAAADIISATIGTVFSILDADSATAMVANVDGTNVGRMIEIGSQFVMAGGIDFVAADATPTSGIADVYLTYRPLAAGVTVTA